MTLEGYIADDVHLGDDPRGDFTRDARDRIAAGQFWEDGEELDGIVALSFEPARIAGLELYRRWYRWREDGVSDAARSVR